MSTEHQIRSQIAEIERSMQPFKRQIRTLKRALRKAKGLPAKRKGQGVRIGDRWPEEKERRGYVEPGSFVRRDGSEKLVGRDWTNRVLELWQRSGGRCEAMRMPGSDLRCFSGARDPHHVIKRSIRRDDRLSNLQHLCRPHHDLLDPRKVKSGKVDA